MAPPQIPNRYGKAFRLLPYFLGILVFIVFIAIVNKRETKEKVNPEQSSEVKTASPQSREEKIAAQFYNDGEHKGLHSAFTMKYSGYKHLKTNHSDNGKNINVTTLFKGDGQLHTVDAIFDIEGNMISATLLR
jgi:hypothetical protein